MHDPLPGPWSRRAGALLVLFVASSCAVGPPRGAPAARELDPGDVPVAPRVRHWGELRQVLREGRTEGRVALADVLGPHTVAVGVSEGLAAEITVVGGAAHLAEVVDSGSPEGLCTRAARDAERAALLVAAEVPRWSERPLGDVPDLAALEAAVRAAAETAGIDVGAPFPFRVEGVASALRLHVLDRSCPVAHPDGPPPWRFSGRDERVILVGFHAEDSGGVLTHHGQRTHTHAVLPTAGVSGHLDEVSFAAGARLFLPAR